MTKSKKNHANAKALKKKVSTVVKNSPLIPWEASMRNSGDDCSYMRYLADAGRLT